MYCEHCGKKIYQDSRFCEHCGRPVYPDMDYGNENRYRRPVQDTIEDVYEAFNIEETEEKRSPKGVYIALGIIVALLFILSGLLAFFLIMGNGGEKDPEGPSERRGTSEKEAGESEEDISEESSTTDETEDMTETGETEVAGTEEIERIPPESENTDAEREPVVLIPEPEAESRYVFVKKDCSWTQAHQECIAMGGHLVHFDTPGEVERVIVEFSAQGYDVKSMFWIGGARNSVNGSSSYHWINSDGTYGEQVSLTDPHWMLGEPSYIDPGLNNILEDKMIMFFYQDEQRWIFNDEPDRPQDYVPAYSERLGYICEIEG